MHVVVATTADDPWAAVFWTAYHTAGGVPPTAVFFLGPKARRSPVRAAVDALAMFGPRDGARLWSQLRAARRLLARDPGSLFPGTTRFERVPSLNAPPGQAHLAAHAPDLLLSVGAPEIFKAAVLRVPSLGGVNIHNGRLPAYRGLFGTFWEMYCGEAWGYTTIHRMVPRVDAGGILVEAPVRLQDSLAENLREKKRLGGRLLAWLTRFTADTGRLPAARPGMAVEEGYFGWPSITDLVRYRRRPRPQRDPVHAAPATWPPELATH